MDLPQFVMLLLFERDVLDYPQRQPSHLQLETRESFVSFFATTKTCNLLTCRIERHNHELAIGCLDQLLVGLQATNAHFAVGCAHHLNFLRLLWLRLWRNWLRYSFVDDSRCSIGLLHNHLSDKCFVLRLLI